MLFFKLSQGKDEKDRKNIVSGSEKWEDENSIEIAEAIRKQSKKSRW
jgi:predicted FMN-binding regulatory protein PaiB